MILHTTGCLASDDVYRCLASEVRHYGILDYCEGQNPLFIRGKAIYTRRSILYIREKLWMCHMQSQLSLAESVTLRKSPVYPGKSPIYPLLRKEIWLRMRHMSDATFDKSSVYFGYTRGRSYETVFRGYLGLFLGYTQHFCEYIGLFCFVFDTSRSLFGYRTLHVTNAWLWHSTYHFHISLHSTHYFCKCFSWIYIRGRPFNIVGYLGLFFGIYTALLWIIGLFCFAFDTVSFLDI